MKNTHWLISNQNINYNADLNTLAMIIATDLCKHCELFLCKTKVALSLSVHLSLFDRPIRETMVLFPLSRETKETHASCLDNILSAAYFLIYLFGFPTLIIFSMQN